MTAANPAHDARLARHRELGRAEETDDVDQYAAIADDAPNNWRTTFEAGPHRTVAHHAVTVPIGPFGRKFHTYLYPENFNDELPPGFNLEFTDEKGRSNITGAGSAAEVIRKMGAVAVNAITRGPDLEGKQPPAHLMFTAAGASRGRLYARVAAAVAAKTGYIPYSHRIVGNTPEQDETGFLLVHPDHAPTVEHIVGEFDDLYPSYKQMPKKPAREAAEPERYATTKRTSQADRLLESDAGQPQQFAREWNESDHPRDPATGEFVEGDETSTAIADDDAAGQGNDDFDPSAFGDEPEAGAGANKPTGEKKKRRYVKKSSTGGKPEKAEGPVKDRKPSPRGYILTWNKWENENLHKHAQAMLEEIGIEPSKDVLAAVNRAIDSYDWGTPRSLLMQIKNGEKLWEKDRSKPLASHIDAAMAAYRDKIGKGQTWTHRKAQFAADVSAAAESYDVTTEEVRDALDYLWAEESHDRADWADAWKELGRHNYTPARFRKLQDDGKDTSNLPGWDESSKIIAREYPILGLSHMHDDDSGDVSKGLDAQLFEIVLNGPDARKEQYTKTSRFNCDRAAELAAHYRKSHLSMPARKGDVEDFARGHPSRYSRDDVDRYARWLLRRGPRQ